MKNKFLMIIGFFIFTIIFNSHAQIIPENRRINWEPGISGSIPQYPVGVNVLNYGAKGDGETDNTQAFNEAIGAAEEGTAVIVPSGDYLLKSRIRITKSIVLRGEGYLKTRLLFDIPGGGNCLEIVRYDESDWVQLSGGYEKGSTAITVQSTSLFSADDYIEIVQDNDPAVYSEGYDGHFEDAAVGQIIQIDFVEGNTLHLKKPLYYTYNGDMNPQLRRQGLVKDAGLEDLYVERISSASWGSNLAMIHAANCWIVRVHSKKAVTAHLFIAESCQNEIRDCYFFDAHEHGGGGKGYGIRCEARSSDNLFENNIFEHLRHSLLVQIGATGNVFGYNYSIDPFFKEKNSYLMADLVSHGHYPYMNLFEGNVVQRIAIDNVWGSSGSNTFFRNRIERNKSHYLEDASEHPYFTIAETSPYQNVIGNEFGKSGIYVENILDIHDDVSEATLLHGNYDYQNSELYWDIDLSIHDLPDSFYLDEKPDWFGDLDWPAIGGDIAPNENIIPAQIRYQRIMNPEKPTQPENLMIR